MKYLAILRLLAILLLGVIASTSRQGMFTSYIVQQDKWESLNLKSVATLDWTPTPQVCSQHCLLEDCDTFAINDTTRECLLYWHKDSFSVKLPETDLSVPGVVELWSRFIRPVTVEAILLFGTPNVMVADDPDSIIPLSIPPIEQQMTRRIFFRVNMTTFYTCHGVDQTCLSWTIGSDTWIQGNPMPLSLYYTSKITMDFGNKVVVVGAGISHDSDWSNQHQSWILGIEVIAFDKTSLTWSIEPPMDVDVMEAVQDAVDSRFGIVFGGEGNLQENSFIQLYDSHKKNFTKLLEIPLIQNAVCDVLLDKLGHIYALCTAGFKSGVQLLNTYTFNLTTHQVRRTPEWDLPSQALDYDWWGQTVVINNQILLMGWQDVVLRFDPENLSVDTNSNWHFEPWEMIPYERTLKISHKYLQL